jgi:hypothetical protein
VYLVSGFELVRRLSGITRFIVTKLHPWLPFFYGLVMFLNWSRDMKIWAIEDGFKWTYGQVGFLRLLQPAYALNLSAHNAYQLQLFAISQVIIILSPCWQLCCSRWQEIALLPRCLVLDMIWLISGKGQPWTNSTESDLILRNLWDAFPRDVTPEDIGLPTTLPAPPLGVTNPFPADRTGVRSTRSRHRRNRTNWRPSLEHVTGPFEEEDIADQVPDQNWIHPLSS